MRITASGFCSVEGFAAWVSGISSSIATMAKFPERERERSKELHREEDYLKKKSRRFARISEV